jgi:hypothetical protein
MKKILISIFSFFIVSSLLAQNQSGYVLVKTGVPLQSNSTATITYKWIATNNTSLNGDFYILENLPVNETIQSVSGSALNLKMNPALPLTGASPLTIGPFPISADASVTFQVAGTSRGQSVGGDTFALLSETQLTGIENANAVGISVSGSPTPEGHPAPIVRAAPNISYDNEPIHFQVNLNSPALVKLTLFSLTGERVFKVERQANAGNSSLVWNIQNNGGQTVASGLYIYLLNITGTGIGQTLSGKVLVLH